MRAVAMLALSIAAACASTSRVEVRHPDGRTSSGAHVYGLRNGPWTELHANGRKQSEGAYENDVQAGPWTWWFENGAKEMEGSFVAERREGEWTSWYENGALRSRGRFERGFEEGPWRFYSSAGALEHEGTFELGRPVLRWTWFRPDGSVRETGAFHAGVRVGAWTTRDDAGRETQVSYPVPTGIEWVEERFPDASVKRSGFLRDKVPAGRWISRHPGGALRCECDFENGSPNGRSRAWRADGTLLASGSLREGSLIGAWTFRRGATDDVVEFQSPRPRATFRGEWSPAVDGADATVVETWLAELCSPVQPAPSSPTTPTENASDLQLESGITARAQAWTEYESRVMPELVKRYGRKSASLDAEDWKTPVLPGRKPGASVASPDDLVGRRLPLTRFTTATGTTIDLHEFAGKRNVLVTILRGFGGQVCVYCAAQTRGLADSADEFAKLDTEVVVVFPGPASGLGAFLEAYRRTFGADAKLPYAMLYDTDLALTRALHIEDNIAVPTSLLLDRQGVIRWSHVAKDYSDRPSARTVLDRIAELPRR